MKKLGFVKLAIFLIAFLISFVGINWWGIVLKKQAEDIWLEKAEIETQQITNTSLYWMSLFYSQLRGIASLFYGSEVITEEEFYKGVELLEEIESESVIPLTRVAYASVESANAKNEQLLVRFSTDIHGVTSVNTDLMQQPALVPAVKLALKTPSRVILSRLFLDERGKLFVALVFYASNDARPGVILSLVNLSDFFDDLDALHVPLGLRLRLVEKIPMEGEVAIEKSVERLMVGTPHASDIIETFYYQTRTGSARWDFYWDVEAYYQGGIDTTLGRVVQVGGSALVLALFAIIGALARQNILVSHQVKLRTHELAEASKALELSNEELRELANRDSLTSIYNRRCFLELAENACSMSRRYGQPLSMIMLDVDHFKRINDCCGHAQGDFVLLGIVNECRSVLREVDLFGRVGGEEFAIMLPETESKEAYHVAERLRGKIAELSFNGNEVISSVTVSMGVSHLFSEGDDSLNNLLKRADDALYQAKRNGRNQVVTYESYMENTAHSVDSHNY